MNKIFKVVWSKSKQCYVVVSEIAKNTTGKKKIIVWCFLYFGDEPYLIVNKYRNIVLYICIIIYLAYKKDVLCNIKRLFFYA